MAFKMWYIVPECWASVKLPSMHDPYTIKIHKIA